MNEKGFRKKCLWRSWGTIWGKTSKMLLRVCGDPVVVWSEHVLYTSQVRLLLQQSLYLQMFAWGNMAVCDGMYLNRVCSLSCVCVCVCRDIVKLTAQFVARNGRQFLTNLMNREQRNYQFDFLRPQHSLFQYFTKLLEQYTKVSHFFWGERKLNGAHCTSL